MSPENKLLPKRIILVRHGESEGNLDTAAYTTTPDHKIQLTDSGLLQAQEAGARLHALISSNPSSPEWRVYFYVSPYDRTRSTLREIGRSFSRRRVIGVREECRIREQDFGNFQVKERMRATKKVRERFGRFFYRFPEGESAADVFDRVSSFLESLWRDIDMNRLHINPSHELNFVIVSHGLTSRVFLMKWFKWTVEQFEGLNNPGNSEIRVMELGQGGDYSLAIHHTEEELTAWGLSPEMIADQKWRVNAHKGEWKDDCKWYFGDFFDHMTDSDQECEAEPTEEEEDEVEGKRVNLLTSSEYNNEAELYNGKCC
ncbi:PREDICTED: phosphoglycerate mutase-like protein AT74 [Camelina sativa]|uniref:Phosphoglycerate mutase-like protein AT74 n=1 Tax=Camelina sativa TaxID=90675 RepID=A0ABM0TD10_CAMSA|nr:PREDICTED: phosphoglycerate mutase-like protein AT74 [Camelina sativa]XP_019100037.1 PREDICTED: phosphoglycerate mutase-like protein AT74 [Camelina sativa]